MKRSHFPLLLLPAALLCLCMASVGAIAQQTTAAEQVEPAAEAVERDADQPAAAPDEDAEPRRSRREKRFRHRHNDHDVIFHFGEDSHLPAGEDVDAVVSIFGNARVEGEVKDVAMAIFGDTHVSGPVGEAAVAIFGNTYVNSEIGGDGAFAIFGNLELGPDAVVDGDIVAVFGTITKDPAAIVRGDTEIVFGGDMGGFDWLRTWVRHCLVLGRPLAFEPGLGWAWAVAFGFLGLYILIALLFGGSVERCVETIEKQPGQTVVASILAVVLTPVLFTLLVASVVGLILVPFAGMALFTVGLFGKAVILAALGRRVTRFTGIGPFGHVAFAVLVGGIIVLGLYVVPVLGFITYKLLGILGLGVVAYTLLLVLRQRRGEGTQPPAAAAAAPAGGAPSAAGPASAVSSGETPAPGSEPGPYESASQASAPNEAAPGEPSQPAAPAPPAVDATTLPRAGFWIRMGALFVDVILVGVVVHLLNPLGDIMLLALAAYGAVMWKLKSTTIGGVVFGLKVIRRDGREMSWDTAVVRALGCFLSLIVAFLGFIWIAFDEERQAWHDKIAGTLVVRVPKGESLL